VNEHREAAVTQPVDPNDLRLVVNLAEQMEDRTPDEEAALTRLNAALHEAQAAELYEHAEAMTLDAEPAAVPPVVPSLVAGQVSEARRLLQEASQLLDQPQEARTAEPPRSVDPPRPQPDL
jgi:hypothetical protein